MSKIIIDLTKNIYWEFNPTNHTFSEMLLKCESEAKEDKVKIYEVAIGPLQSNAELFFIKCSLWQTRKLKGDE